MPDVLVFGATGFTGRLTAHELFSRNADFAIAGRNESKLRELARVTGGPEVRVVAPGDADALARHLADAKVLITCVGPFVEHGRTAVEAALRARVNYVDSTGEGSFVEELVRTRDGDARAAGIAMAPAMGFDEVPGDVAATLATEGLDDPELILTYALPAHGSRGTVKSALGIITSSGTWVADGRRIEMRAGHRERWAPMPPPLGPRRGVSFPLAIGHLVPLHLDLTRLELYVTSGSLQRIALRAGVPLLRAARAVPLTRDLPASLVDRLQRSEGPEGSRRAAKWTILAEARGSNDWKNVTLVGHDVYGLTARLLAAASLHMARPEYDRTGVLSPVQAVGSDLLEKELVDHGASIEIYGRR